MTNTKFRKRALLSSVAMLLVALVALGSATFAWFTTNPNSQTNSLTLKATSSLGLVVQSETEKGVKADKWSHDAILHAKATSASDNTPIANTEAVSIGAASQDASSATGAKGIYTIAALNDNQWNPDTSKNVENSTGSTSGGNHYEEKLYMKVTGSTQATVTLTEVTINNVGSTNLAKALRVAILDSEGNLLGIFKPSGATDNKYLSATGTYAQSSAAYTAYTSGALDTPITVGTVDATGNDYITIRAFLDGEDQAVYSQNITSVDMTSVMSGLVIKLHAA